MNSSSNRVVLQARDGFTVKDGRGFNFSGGLAAESLPWPLPPTLAGAVRTAVGTARGYLDGSQHADWPALQREVAVLGPLPVWHALGGEEGGWQPLWPAPADAFATTAANGELEVHRMQPQPPGQLATVRASFSRPDPEAKAIDSLWRAALPVRKKPHAVPGAWSQQDLCHWLFDAPVPLPLARPRLLPRQRTDTRLSVSPATGTAEDGMLYSLQTMETLCWHGSPPRARQLGIYARIAMPKNERLPDKALWRFGGEQRMVNPAVIHMEKRDPFREPPELRKWQDTRHFRLMLVTPAVFAAGWRPDWLTLADDGSFSGVLPGIHPPLSVTLRAALCQRPVPVSGWDVLLDQPKASRRLAPVGTVYFFTSTRDVTADDARSLWLHQVVEPDTQVQRDGYGAVVPGAWQP